MLAVSKIADIWRHVTAVFFQCSSLDRLPRPQILLEAGIDSSCVIVLLHKGSAGHLILFVTFMTCICGVKLPKAESRRGSSPVGLTNKLACRGETD